MGLVAPGRDDPPGPWGGWRGDGAACGGAGDVKLRPAAGPVGGALSAAGPLGGDFIGVEFASVAGGLGVSWVAKAGCDGCGGAGSFGVSRTGRTEAVGVGALEM